MQGDTERHAAGGWPAQDRDALYLEYLEQRRQSADRAMWQAPALMIVAQAFLLQVLTDSTVDLATRIVVTIAVVGATLAAALTLLRLRSQEVVYSEAIARKLGELEMGDPRAAALPTADAGSPERSPHVWWTAALALFAIADVVALVLA
jgi:hypothetical protein